MLKAPAHRFIDRGQHIKSFSFVSCLRRGIRCQATLGKSNAKRFALR